MFQARIETIEPDRITRYSLKYGNDQLTFSDVIERWESDTSFRAYFTKLLAESSFAGYRWETPALTKATVNHPFEFVLLNSPRFCTRKTDQRTYAKYFTTEGTNEGVVSFSNLSGDASLIVPSPRTEIDAYGHLAAFIRKAPEAQHDAFWQVVSQTVQSRLSDRPIWLNTAGGAVAWLHVRIDSRPKYYGYLPYKAASLTGQRMKWGNINH